MNMALNFLRTLGDGFVVMTAIVGSLLGIVTGVATFVAWDLSIATRWLDWTTLRLCVSVGFVLGLWFTLSKEGRSEWMD